MTSWAQSWDGSEIPGHVRIRCIRGAGGMGTVRSVQRFKQTFEMRMWREYGGGPVWLSIIDGRWEESPDVADSECGDKLFWLLVYYWAMCPAVVHVRIRTLVDFRRTTHFQLYRMLIVLEINVLTLETNLSLQRAVF